MTRITVAFAALSLSAVAFAQPAHADCQASAAGYNDGKYFVADSFSFGVEREMKESGEKGKTEDINIGVGEIQLASRESGEKGGTADINIGVGELQECTISKSMD